MKRGRHRAEEEWACVECRFQANEAFHSRCQACEAPRPAGTALEWRCQTCLFANNADDDLFECRSCHAQRPGVEAPNSKPDPESPPDDGPLISDEEKRLLETQTVSRDTLDTYWPKKQLNMMGVEYAKNSRSKCQTCHKSFVAGELRAWTNTEYGGGSIDSPFFPFHVACVPFPPISERFQVDPPQGLDLLKSDRDRQRVRAIIDFVYSPETQQKRASALAAKRSSPAARAQGDKKIDFGKHKGKTFAEVAESDPSYCQWAIELNDRKVKGTMRAFRSYLKLMGFEPK